MTTIADLLPGPGSKRLAAATLCALAALSLSGCVDEIVAEQVKIDQAAEALPFPRPVIEPLNALPGVPPLPEQVQRTLELRRAFFARDFAKLQKALTEAHDDYVAGRTAYPKAGPLINSIQETNLAGIDACDDWLKAMPNSYPAHWVCAAMWQSGAWSARGEKYASETSPARFAMMRERLHRSNALLQRAITLTPKPVEAFAMLGANHFLGGDRQQAEGYLARAEEILPRHLGTHHVRLHYRLPEWGGSKELVLAGFEQAKKAGVAPDDLLDLEDEYVVRPWKMSVPGAARAYWEKAIKTRATRSRLEGLVKNLVWLQNWNDALPVANRLIETYPDSTAGYYQRARINEELGRIPEARADYRVAAAMGHDFALQTLSLANVRGGLGLPGKNFEEVLLLCRYGATLGSGVGANCIGSLYFEAGGIKIPLRPDTAQAFAWHELGARAGHYNSQHDLGWMLFSNRAPAVGAERAKALGIFWLRRAAEQDHAFAKKRLEENRISLSEELPERSDGSAMYILYQILRAFI